MKHVNIKIRFVFYPLLLLSFCFIAIYLLLYWLLCIQLDILPVRQDIIHLWVPMAASFLCVLMFIRPKVHLLKLGKDNDRLRTLYYMIAAAVFCAPTVWLMNFVDTATGKLTKLESIIEIKQRPATKYYSPGSFVLNKSFVGTKQVMSYSGKNSQHLDFDIYIALPVTGHLYDTLQSPAAFLSIKYHKQISSNISDGEREIEWDRFSEQSFNRFDNDLIKFQYLERIPNTEDRSFLIVAAKKSGLYQQGSPVIILKPIDKPFSQRNGNDLRYAALSFGIGLVLWLFMIAIPGLHLHKTSNVKNANKNYIQKELYALYELIRPRAGFTATPILMLLNVFVFIAMVIKGVGFISFYSEDLIRWGAIYKPLIQQGQWWRLLTCMFLHGGVMHLLMNMFSLYIAGLFLEKSIGTKRFVTGYIIAGIVAGFVSLWWHEKPVVAVGASGAIFGLYGILLSLIISKVFDPLMNKMLLILLGCTAGYGLIMGFLSKGIDNSAHLGGLVAGLLIGFVYAKSMLKPVAD